jgi:hypothetical protein
VQRRQHRQAEYFLSAKFAIHGKLVRVVRCPPVKIQQCWPVDGTQNTGHALSGPTVKSWNLLEIPGHFKVPGRDLKWAYPALMRRGATIWMALSQSRPFHS